MSLYGIRMLSDAKGEFVFNEGVWLKFYDPDANGGHGGFVLTDDPSEALAFYKASDAVDAALRVSTVRPIENGGAALNRPIENFRYEIVELPG